MGQADILVVVFDATVLLEPIAQQLYKPLLQELIELKEQRNTPRLIPVVNKIDLLRSLESAEIEKLKQAADELVGQVRMPAERTHLVSALNGTGVEPLIDTIGQWLARDLPATGMPLMVNQRQIASLEKLIELLDDNQLDAARDQLMQLMKIDLRN